MLLIILARSVTQSQGGDDILDQVSAQKVEKKLFRLSDSKGSLQLTPVASGKVTKSMLDPNDVFLFDTGFEVTSFSSIFFIWFSFLDFHLDWISSECQ